MARKVHFKVSLVCPKGAGTESVQAYVEGALAEYRGMLAPPGGGYDNPEQAAEFGDGDPMRALDPDTIKVVATKR